MTEVCESKNTKNFLDDINCTKEEAYALKDALKKISDYQKEKENIKINTEEVVKKIFELGSNTFCKNHNCDKKPYVIDGKTFYFCEKCENEYEKEDAEVNQKKEEERIRKSIEELSKMRIEPEFYNSSLTNYRAETESQKQALEAVKRLVENKKGKVILIGGNGTGKTHLATSAIKILGGVIYTMYEISVMIRSSYKANSIESELDIVDKLARHPLLVIDEIGRTKGSDVEKNWLSYIIDKRHVRGLPIIIISNNHRRRDCKKNGCDRCLENYFDNDVLSRFKDGTSVIDVKGKDFRGNK